LFKRKALGTYKYCEESAIAFVCRKIDTNGCLYRNKSVNLYTSIRCAVADSMLGGNGNLVRNAPLTLVYLSDRG
jgi:hypothetical protein